MAATQFSVHIEKENATPAPIFNKVSSTSTNKSKSFGVQKNGGNLTQPTPRKALYDHDVNQDRQLSAKVSGGKSGGLNSKENVFNPVKPSRGLSLQAENQPFGPSMKKPSLKKEKTAEKSTLKPSKQKTQVKPAPPLKPEPSQEEEEDGYDSDSIFPRSERLSTYVDKLLAWRPPCLFGSIPDSESEHSDTEDWMPQDLLGEDDLNDLPDLSDPNLTGLLEALPTTSTDLAPLDPGEYGLAL